MVSHPQIGVGARFESIHTVVSIDAGPTSISHQDVHAIPPGVGGRSGGPLAVIQLLRVTSFWEATLIVILSLLISALVGIRIADALSERELELPSLALGTDPTGATDDPSDAATADREPPGSYLSPETPPRLLSDEGTVVRLLIANDGRIRQRTIAAETGWSKSKVSRICSRMHADRTIEKRSLGRENVIVFAERPVGDETQSDDAESPAA
ncbi:helix-turn-helix transcriptional regulator [Natrinema thermotolerans]